MHIGSKGGHHTSEYLEKKRKERKKRLIISFITLILVVGIPIYVSRLERFRISGVEVAGAAVTDAQEVEQVVDDVIGRNYLWLVPKSNVFIYPKDTLREELLARVPRLKLAEPDIGEDRKLKIMVEERKPFALYCIEVPSLATEAGCYFLDETGFIFDRAPAFSGDVYFIYTGGSSEPLGTNFMPESEFRAVGALVDEIGKIRIYPRVFDKKESEYHLVLQNGARIMWNASDDIERIYSNLYAFMSSDAIKGDKGFLDRVSYLDLRTPNKVFYRFQE